MKSYGNRAHCYIESANVYMYCYKELNVLLCLLFHYDNLCRTSGKAARREPSPSGATERAG